MSFETVTIGPATLICGDCLQVLPTLRGVDAVVTDPPYGIGLQTKTSDYRDSQHFDRGESLRASKLYDDAPEFIRSQIPLWHAAATEATDRQLWFCGQEMQWDYPRPRATGVAFSPAGAGCCAWGFQCSHPILYYGKDPYIQNGLGRRPNSFRDDQPNRERFDHPCPKPLPWMKWATERASLDGERVCDPFMGSGTTGVACIKTGRRFIGIEIEPKYFAIACERIRKAWKLERSKLPLEKPVTYRQPELIEA